MDLAAYNLARAIKRTESGSGDTYNTRGKSGEYGAYQFMPKTWKGWAGEILGNPNAPLTKENQNKVAYTKIKTWKDQGYTPKQIAAMWNSGQPDWEGKVGVNKFGVKYNVPLYVNKVYAGYNELKGQSGGQKQMQPQQEEAPTIEEQKEELRIAGKPVSRRDDRVEPTWGGSIVRDIVKPFAKVAAGVANIPRVARGEDPRALKSDYLGDIKPMEASAFKQLPYTLRGEAAPANKQQGSFGQELKDAIGTGVEIGSYVPFGAGAKVATGVARQALNTAKKMTLKGTAKKAGTLAAEGAIGTAMYKGGRELQGDNQENWVRDIALGAVAGPVAAVAGRAIGKVGRGARKVTALATGRIPEDIASEASERLPQAWGELAEDAKPLRDYVTKQKAKGKDIMEILGSENYVPELNKGALDTRGLIEKATDDIGKYATMVDDYAKAFDDVSTPLESIYQGALNVLKSSDEVLASGNLNKAMRELGQRMEGLQAAYGSEVPTSTLNTIRKEMNQQTKAFMGEKFEQDVADAIADAVREKLDEIVPDDTMRRVNKKIGSLIAARQFLKKADGKKLMYGKMSTMMARLLGATVGSQAGLPIVSPLLGAAGGDAAVRVASKWKFSTPMTRAILKKMTTNKELAREITQKTLKAEVDVINRRPRLPAPKTGAPQASNYVPINLPKKAQSTVDATEARTMNVKGISKKAKELTEKNGGFTISLKGDVPSKGFAVSPSKETETIFDFKEKTVKESDIEGFIEKWYNNLQEGPAHLGGWVDGDRFVLDVSHVYSNTADAIKVAKASNQDAIFNFDNFESIYAKDYEKYTSLDSNKGKVQGGDKGSLPKRAAKKGNKGDEIEPYIPEDKLPVIKMGKLPKKKPIKDGLPEIAFAGAALPALGNGEKLIEETDEYRSSKSGLFGNKRKFERKDKGVPTKEKEPLKYTPRPLKDLPVVVSKDKVKELETRYNIPNGTLEAIMMLESSMGTNTASADKGEMKWLTGLTEVAIKDIKKKVAVGRTEDILDATAAFFALLKKRHPNMSLGELYVKKYWGGGKKHPELAEKKADEFEQLLAYYSKN